MINYNLTYSLILIKLAEKRNKIIIIYIQSVQKQWVKNSRSGW